MFQSGNVKVILLFCMLFHITFSCTYNADQDRVHCSSFDELKRAGPHAEWNKLNLINDGNSQFSPIKRDTFQFYPNVKDLQVKGLSNGIEKGAFNGLIKLYELHLDDNKFNIIPPRAFENLPITVIYIYFCDVHEILPKAFDKLPKLTTVFIYGNYISTIEEGVFSETKIQYLFLRKNAIKNVAPNAFGDMDELVHLSLEENELLSFEPQFAIGFAPKLTHLYINRNKLSKATRDMFSVVPNLQILLININNIRRFGDHAFKDLKKLALLDISNNRLEEIQSNVFNSGGHPSMQLLFLHDNQLSFLSSGVLIRLPNLLKMSVGGNPWQCPCWKILDEYMLHNNVTRLCYDEYSQGERPFCVFSDTHPKDCIYDIENVQDMPHIYAEAIKDYSKLPPVCNVDGVSKPILGA